MNTSTRLLTFILAGLLAWTVMAWLQRWPDGSVTPPILSMPTEVKGASAELIGKALGDTSRLDAGSPAENSAGLALAGIMGLPQGEGIALVSIDGRSAKAFRRGQVIRPGLFVVQIEPRRVVLGPAPDAQGTVVLELKGKRPGLP